jgi:hypothetical protein
VSNVFVKRHELHYQPKKVETLEGEMVTQHGCLNFHAKRDGGLKLSLAMKNKWSTGGQDPGFIAASPAYAALRVEKRARFAFADECA